MRQTSSRQLQLGLSMLEALITMLLLAIIGIGIAFVAGRTMVAQRNASTQHLAVSQMREALKSGACDSSAPTAVALNIASNPVSASCQSDEVTLTVVPASGAQQVVQVSIPQISVDHEMFGGKVVVDSVR